MNEITDRSAQGYGGEQAMAWVLSQWGFFLVDGPSGTGGHAWNAPGFDGVAYNPTTGCLLIYDNKTFQRGGNVASATAIDPAKNLGRNLDRLRESIQMIGVLPHKAHIHRLVEQTSWALKHGSPWPLTVHIAVTNAYGKSTGVTKRLENLGVKFFQAHHGSPPGASAPLKLADAIAAFEIEVRRPKGSSGTLDFKVGGRKRWPSPTTCWWDPKKRIPEGAYVGCSATHMTKALDSVTKKQRPAIYIPNIPGYSGVFVHEGKNEGWSDGCIVCAREKVIEIFNAVPRDGKNITVVVFDDG